MTLRVTAAKDWTEGTRPEIQGKANSSLSKERQQLPNIRSLRKTRPCWRCARLQRWNRHTL